MNSHPSAHLKKFATSYSRAAAASNGPTVRSGMANIRGHGYGYRDVERHDEGLDEALVEAAADS